MEILLAITSILNVVILGIQVFMFNKKQNTILELQKGINKEQVENEKLYRRARLEISSIKPETLAEEIVLSFKNYAQTSAYNFTIYIEYNIFNNPDEVNIADLTLAKPINRDPYKLEEVIITATLIEPIKEKDKLILRNLLKNVENDSINAIKNRQQTHIKCPIMLIWGAYKYQDIFNQTIIKPFIHKIEFFPSLQNQGNNNSNIAFIPKAATIIPTKSQREQLINSIQ